MENEKKWPFSKNSKGIEKKKWHTAENFPNLREDIYILISHDLTRASSRHIRLKNLKSSRKVTFRVSWSTPETKHLPTSKFKGTHEKQHPRQVNTEILMSTGTAGITKDA